MRKALVIATLSGALLLTFGTARSSANTISFNDSSTQLDGLATIPEMMPTAGPDSVSSFLPLDDYDNGTCGPSGNAVYGCQSGSPESADGPVTSDDFPRPTFGFLSASVATTPDGLMGPTNVCEIAPMACGDTPIGTFEPETEIVRDYSMPAFDTAAASTEEVVAPSFSSEADAVPESGSLMLVGIGLLVGAKYLRLRKIA